MSAKVGIACGLLIGLLASCVVLADEPLEPKVKKLAEGLPAPGQFAVLQPAQPQPEPPDVFTQAPPQGPSGSSNAGSGHPHMIGDLNGGAYIRRILVCGTQTFVVDPGPQFPTVELPIFCVANIALASRGAFKIGENESPVPTDRVYLSYNYFSNVAVLAKQEFIVPPPPPPPGTPASFQAKALNKLVLSNSDAGASLIGLDTQREVFGIEKTLFSEDFSVGLRMPLIQEIGATALDNSQLGDLSFVFKYAFYRDREAGNAVSAGLVLTVPNGEDVFAVNGEKIHPTLIQPFIGWFLNRGALYFHGFSSVIVPTEDNDVSLLCNDVAVGYRLYEDACAQNLVRFIAPTLEAHITTPLNHEGATERPFGFPNIFVGTAAVHVGLGDFSTVTLGVGIPMSGPQPFDVEGIAQFNLRF